MKRVFNNSQLAHVWANQSQESGHNPGNSMYFEGTKIWSYGSHYLMGEIHTAKNGTKYALINEHGYSPTTGKQRSCCVDALHNLIPYWYASDPSSPEQAVLDSEDNLISETFGYFLTKREQWGNPIERVKERYESHNHLCDMVGVPKHKLTMTDDLEWLYTEHRLLVEKRQAELNTPEALAKKEALRVRREELKQAKLRVKLAENIKDFHEFKRGNVHGLSPVLIRVRGEVVETSGGAQVPLRAALRLLNAIDNGSVTDGFKVGHFTYESQDGGVVKIGCHRIDIEQARGVLVSHE